MNEIEILKKILDLIKENRDKDYSINTRMTKEEQRMYFWSRNKALSDVYDIIVNSIEDQEYKKEVDTEMDIYFQKLFFTIPEKLKNINKEIL